LQLGWDWCRSKFRQATGQSSAGISRRGNRYLRTLFVQGIRAVLFRHKSWTRYGFGRWLTNGAQRLHKNVLAIALANKLGRIAWALLYRDSCYEPEFAVRETDITRMEQVTQRN
jgi:transposase